MQISRAGRANSRPEAPRTVCYKVRRTWLLSRGNEVLLVNTLALLDPEIPPDGPVSPGPEPLRGRDLLRTSLRPISADSTVTPVEDVGDSSRLSENRDAAEDWARHTSRDRREAFIEAVFKTALPADRHKQPTGSSSNSSLDPTLLASGFSRWSSSGSDIVDGLRRFTSVDILEGENAFACKRCWEESQRRKRHFVQSSDKVGRPMAGSDGGSEVSASLVASDSPKERTATPSLDSSRVAKQLYQENLESGSKKTDEGDLGRRGPRQESLSSFPKI